MQLCVISGPFLPELCISFSCTGHRDTELCSSQFRVVTWLEMEHFIFSVGWRSGWATCFSGLQWAELLPLSPPHWRVPFCSLSGPALRQDHFVLTQQKTLCCVLPISLPPF